MEKSFGDADITIAKENGKIENFILPNEENFKLLEIAENLEIPNEFKITKEETIDLYTKKFRGYSYFLLIGANDDTIIETLLESLNSRKEVMPENKNNDY